MKLSVLVANMYITIDVANMYIPTDEKRHTSDAQD